MKYQYHIELTHGVIQIDRVHFAKETKNPTQYFGKGKKPKKISVIGWPFAHMFVEIGTEENGFAVAWTK